MRYPPLGFETFRFCVGLTDPHVIALRAVSFSVTICDKRLYVWVCVVNREPRLKNDKGISGLAHSPHKRLCLFEDGQRSNMKPVYPNSPVNLLYFTMQRLSAPQFAKDLIFSFFQDALVPVRYPCLRPAPIEGPPTHLWCGYHHIF
jgi:hypothetical protein